MCPHSHYLPSVALADHIASCVDALRDDMERTKYIYSAGLDQQCRNPTTPTPSSAAATGMDETAGTAEGPRAVGWEWLEPAAEEATAPLRVRKEWASHLPTALGKAPYAGPRRGPDPDGAIWTPTRAWGATWVPAHPAFGMDPRMEDPRMADHPEDPKAEDHPENRQGEDHLEDQRAEDCLEDP